MSFCLSISLLAQLAFAVILFLEVLDVLEVLFVLFERVIDVIILSGGVISIGRMRRDREIGLAAFIRIEDECVVVDGDFGNSEERVEDRSIVDACNSVRKRNDSAVRAAKDLLVIESLDRSGFAFSESEMIVVLHVHNLLHECEGRARTLVRSEEIDIAES